MCTRANKLRLVSESTWIVYKHKSIDMLCSFIRAIYDQSNCKSPENYYVVYVHVRAKSVRDITAMEILIDIIDLANSCIAPSETNGKATSNITNVGFSPLS